MAYKLDMTGEEFTNWMSNVKNNFTTLDEAVASATDKFEETDASLSSINSILTQTFTYEGRNPITSSDEDTYTYWKTKNTGIYWFANNKAVGVNTYGYLIHLNSATGEVQQLFIIAPNGKWYVRGANNSGWYSSSGQSTGCGNDYWTQLT